MLGKLKHELGGDKDDDHGDGSSSRRVEAAPVPSAGAGDGRPPLHPPSPFDAPTGPAASPPPGPAEDLQRWAGPL